MDTRSVNIPTLAKAVEDTQLGLLLGRWGSGGEKVRGQSFTQLRPLLSPFSGLLAADLITSGTLAEQH